MGDFTATQNEPIEVPVAFHIIQNSSGKNTVTLEQLNQQIDALNAGFAGVAVFSLSSVETSVNDGWFECQYASEPYNQMIANLHAGDARTLNVYLYEPYRVTPGDSLGYSGYPWEYSSDPENDGISLAYNTVPGSSDARYNQGKTLVHEAGHWLGLFHTFEPPDPSSPLSASNNGCKGRGDWISDTPAEKVAHYSCSKRRDTCPSKGFDPLSNYMNYTDDPCLTEFTPRQLARVRKMWSVYRAGG